MKFLFVLCAVVAVAVALPKPDGEDKEKIKQNVREKVNACVEKTGTTNEVAEKLRYGDFSVRDEPAQCFMKCFFNDVANFYNEQNELVAEKIIKTLKEKAEIKVDNLEELINNCVKEKGKNDCETAYKVYECYRGKIDYKKEM